MDVTLLVFHDAPNDEQPPLTRLLGEVRTRLAMEQERLFRAASVARVIRLPGRATSGASAGTSFGEHLAAVVATERLGGLIVMGSGAVPRLTTTDARRLVDAASGDAARALTNNRYSSDVIAVARASVLTGLPALPSDNALPRWLEEHAGYAVTDLPARERLALDLDSPLDIALWSLAPGAPAWARTTVAAHGIAVPRSEELRALAADPRRELVVFGRAGSRTLAWLERNVRCRVRFLAEERGLRASSPLAIADRRAARASTTPTAAEPAAASGGRPRRAPRATLGRLLEAHGGPAALAGVIAGLGDGAILDTRVLMADRLGADEDAWPSAEDRFGSDLLRTDAVGDPWLRALTAAADDARIPIILGAHTLVGPGIPLLLRGARRKVGHVLAGTRR